MRCRAVRSAAALLAGTAFGAGLALSGLTDPAVVLGFLDVAGAWNPALLWVMAAAVTVVFLGYRLVWRRGRPLLDEVFHLSASRAADARLIAGAALFGAGWGLAGWCPGPAIASVIAPSLPLALFLAGMIAGTAAVRLREATR
jgi:uncharacterized membrane protein YedE/YeeE